jgi:predicted metal-dependent phosphotriesterase family hydrolase
VTAGLVRTVRGDVDPVELGVTYMHEHLIIDSPLVAEHWPEILLANPDDAVAEVKHCVDAGVGAMVDAMPMASGRGPERLARISEETGVHVVMATGLHTEKYYAHLPWVGAASVDDLAGLFVQDVEVGADSYDHLHDGGHRTSHRAGIIKVATGGSGMTDTARGVFEAAAIASRRTGVPILTHCEDGLGGMEHIELLSVLGVQLSRVVLSHTDKVADASYHTDLLDSGVNLEFDQALRQQESAAADTTALLTTQIEGGFSGQLMLGTDGARRSLWATFGGRPGLAWLAAGYRTVLADAGIDEAMQRTLFEENPQRFLGMMPPEAATESAGSGFSKNRSQNDSRETV